MTIPNFRQDDWRGSVHQEHKKADPLDSPPCYGLIDEAEEVHDTHDERGDGEDIRCQILPD
ncbi:MAG: hypothetical protein KBC06_02300 [Candidatus Pacebacteria bacterium]|nr:hypothetical protein [Candidatus Paceibacterota bacterium]